MIKNNNLKEIRLKKGIRQQALQLMAGVSNSTLTAIERYGAVPGEDVKKRIAFALGVEESEIWELEEGEDG
ncbi:MAG: helix-turn-helix transcriptional regulator [Limnochordia bacterium]|nr:helix-turn-helix transcriptional regulator [Limnochordia bacterium]